MLISEQDGYINRLIDPVVKTYLHAFGAVEIYGTMWSGKTWTSLHHANSSIRLDSPENRELVELMPDALLKGDRPRLIDEWQEYTPSWDMVRRAVDDASGQKGLYLLTGSSRPAKGDVHHSGSGRIARIRMWPMSLAESNDSSKRVSLSGLFEGEFKAFEEEVKLEHLAELIVRGGWPESMGSSDSVSSLVPAQYVDVLVSSQDRKAPASERDLYLFLQSIARNIGSSVKIDTLVKDMRYEVEGAVTETGRRKTRSLIDYFCDRYVLDPMHGWEAPIKSPSRLRTKPRYNFADSSLPAALLGVDAESLMKNMQLFGQLFEQLCIRDLNVYTSVLSKALPGSLRYYRDADGLEVDAIIELRDGRWGAIEIKLGWNKIKQGVDSLLRLKKKIAANPAARNPDPSFMMVLVGKCDRAFKTEEGVYVVPIMSLTA